MSGSSGIGTHSVPRYTSAALSVADAQNLSALLGGTAWNGATITYSFPTTPGQYGTQVSYGDNDPFNGMSSLDSAGHSGQRAEAQRAFGLIASYTLLTFTQITETITSHATVRFANGQCRGHAVRRRGRQRTATDASEELGRLCRRRTDRRRRSG